MGRPIPKIAIISLSLARGGAERFAAMHSHLLTDLGYEVHNITIEADVVYDYAGALYNLGKICETDGKWWRKIKKGLLLKRYLEKHGIDTIIDNRTRPVWLREWAVKRIYGNRKKIYMVHSFALRNYVPRLFTRDLFADAKLVCVSQAIEKLLREQYNLPAVTIYNPVPPIPKDVAVDIPSKFVLYFGRLDDSVKNFELMLEAYALSGLADQNCPLLIMGDGPDADVIVRQAQKRGIENHVQLLPFQHNPYSHVRRARFTLLTSRYEGFPMSIIESLALGVPVVSVDCESGPSEVIRNRQNGLLVPNHDASALAQAIAELANNDDLFDICRSQAAASVAHLSVENIAAQWQKILNS